MYAYIKLPYTKVKKPERNQKKEQSILGSLKSVANGDFSDADGIFSQISEGVSMLDEINSKFSVVAMSQMLMDGNVGSKDALDYLCTGLAPQLGFTSVALGFQSIGAMKEALSGGNIDAGQFLSSLGDVTGYLADQEKLNNINKEEVIFLDLVLSESFTKAAETAERRVQKGQTLSSFIHNLPITGELTCQFIEGKNYSKSEFDWQLDYLRNRQVTFTLQLGDDEFTGYALTNYLPSRNSAIQGFEYNLSFKHIDLGSVATKKINIRELNAKYQQSANIVKNPDNDKTENKQNLGGIKEIYSDAKGAYDDFLNN